MTTVWKRARYRLEWLGVRVLALVIPRLPRRLCHGIANCSAEIACLLHVPGRRIAIENLRVAFGQRYNAAERLRLTRSSYRHFARGMADLFWSPRLTNENISQYVDVSAVDALRAESRTDRGIIFACLHYGGFEWIGPALGFAGFESTIVTQGFSNTRLEATFKRLREVSGHQTIRRQRAILRLFKALQGGRNVILAVDLTVSAKLPSVPIRCFGLRTCVTFAHAWLQKHTGATIIPTHCEPLPDGRYRLVMHPAIRPERNATPQEVAQACWDRFEPVIRAHPAPWLWMYKHWRYRPTDAVREYPEYSNESPHFEKLVKLGEGEAAAPENLPVSEGTQPLVTR